MQLQTGLPSLPSIAPQASFPTSLGQFNSQFAQASRQGLTPGGMMSNIAPKVAGLGAMTGVLGAMQPNYSQIPTSTATASNYKGPYLPAPRTALVNTRPISDTSEFVYFSPVNPFPNVVTAASQGYAEGGKVPIKDGSFIVDARTVSELGNGSSRAGQDLLAKYGGKTLHGPGDGVSDSIAASIGGTQKARVARDEVQFDPEAVARIGGGDQQKGTKKLYALMDKAHSARKRAGRGSDTNLRKGLLD